MEEEIEADIHYDEFNLTIGADINQSEDEHRSDSIKSGLTFGAEQGVSGLYKKMFWVQKCRRKSGARGGTGCDR